ncbi:MAG: DUF732 domain-containing protein [Patescibacteria group bacterium]|jgi:hypothetical protein
MQRETLIEAILKEMRGRITAEANLFNLSLGLDDELIDLGRTVCPEGTTMPGMEDLDDVGSPEELADAIIAANPQWAEEEVTENLDETHVVSASNGGEEPAPDESLK